MHEQVDIKDERASSTIPILMLTNQTSFNNNGEKLVVNISTLTIIKSLERHNSA